MGKNDDNLRRLQRNGSPVEPSVATSGPLMNGPVPIHPVPTALAFEQADDGMGNMVILALIFTPCSTMSVFIEPDVAIKLFTAALEKAKAAKAGIISTEEARPNLIVPPGAGAPPSNN